MRHENTLAIGDGDIGVVACTTDLQMGSTESVQLETCKERLILPLNPCPLQQAREVGITDDVLENRVAAIGVCIGAAIPQSMIRDALDPDLQIALLLLKERTAVRHQILQIADLWPVNSGIVDFSDDAVPHRKP